MLQGIRALARGQARLPLQAQGQQKSLQAQQKRFMSGEDDGVHRCGQGGAHDARAGIAGLC